MVNSYGGSCFTGHYTAADLKNHFHEKSSELGVTGTYLLHLGMDGPRINLKFQKDLELELKAKEDTLILNLGPCSLHPVHTAFKNGLHKLNFPFASSFNDVSFFFKLSSARREDYAGVSSVTGVVAEFAKTFVEIRWLCMKCVGVRCLEQ